MLRPDPGTRVSGFKEIRFHLQGDLFAPTLDFLRRFFPNCRFVFNTRDHAAVCRSGWWAEIEDAKVRAHLTRAEALFSAYIAAHPDLCCRVHYDDYTADPALLQPLFDFLGEPMDRAAVDRVLQTRLTHARGASESTAEG